MEVKVCIIGDSNAGKTSLSMRYCHGDFPEHSTPTIGASFLQRRVLIDTTEISLQIWDTAGQERFKSMASMYYRNAKGAICVFDVTNEDSFNRVTSWVRDLKSHCDPNVVICIAGNKCDQPAAFDLTKVEDLATSLGATFIRTSALTGEGIDTIFYTLSCKIKETYGRIHNESKDSNDSRVKLSDTNSGSNQTSSCC